MKASARGQKLFITRVTVFAVALFLCLLTTGPLGCGSTKYSEEEKTEIKTETIPFNELRENDPLLPKGQTMVKQEGSDGTKEVTYKVTYLEGKMAMKEKISETILKQPVPKIILVGTQGASNFGEPRTDASPETFHGEECTQDCSGHEAGYAWAKEHGITDPDDCGGNSQSFIEGCQAYAEELAEEEGDDYVEDGYYEGDYYEDEY